MPDTPRFFMHFAIAMAAYAIAVLISVLLLATLPEGGLRTLCALLPVAPLFAVAATVVRQVRQLDELARSIHFEALAMAFVGTALLTFSYGFLETAGFPRLSMFFVWPLLASLWALGTWIAWRRYR
ncbi:hypothetical protein SAMN05216588_11264 [Pseudomonas flavescens]|uniref:Uncharacterized protein n=1 Tax=Phytopseudomonas flavescens TaxID=29435 RepID=A0A1G8IDG2_9GAMM|nr:hypothetical protein [Pseudomonas flavescens]SDI17058.1 hypothetical protein SAMN05216588_11264 [Pseudomonas flavescens]